MSDGVVPPPEQTTPRIRLFVCDIDGCLSKGSTHPIPLRLVQRFQDANIRSLTDPDFPAITFCTGRTQPYVECLLQVTAGYLPAAVENGTVLFEPTRYEIHLHPEFTQQEQDILRGMRELIDEHMIQPGVQHEPGKHTHFTLLYDAPLKPQDFVEKAEELSAQFPGWFRVECTKMCVHFLFNHLHKGCGVDWISETTGIPLEAMAGLGDARPDLFFLTRVGLPCAPANAHADVKAVCKWHSTLDDADAAIEFLDAIIEHNRSITRAELVQASASAESVETPAST